MESKLEQYTVTPLATGAAAGLFTYALFGNEGNVELGPLSVSPVVAMAVLGAGASMAGSAISDEINKQSSVSELDDATKMLIKPALTGLVLVAGGRVFIGEYQDMIAMAKMGGLGVAASVSGTYVSGMTKVE